MSRDSQTLIIPPYPNQAVAHKFTTGAIRALNRDIRSVQNTPHPARAHGQGIGIMAQVPGRVEHRPGGFDGRGGVQKLVSGAGYFSSTGCNAKAARSSWGVSALGRRMGGFGVFRLAKQDYICPAVRHK